MTKKIWFIIFLVWQNIIYVLIAQGQTVLSKTGLHEENFVQSQNESLHNNGFAGHNYNVIYHRTYWEIDPSILFINGYVVTHFKTIQPAVSQISFNLSDSLSVDSVIFREKQCGFYQTSQQYLIIDIMETLSIGSTDSVIIYYHGIPQFGEWFGSFDQGYHNGTPVVWTFSQPFGAGDWWPCKNDLSDKIDSMDIFVKTPLPYRVASCGILIDSIPSGDHTIYHWQHRYPITACLVGVAVTNYVSYSDYVEIDGKQLEVLNYVYPESYPFVMQQTVGVLPMIEFFSDLFIPYPFINEKYGHAMFEHEGGVQTQTMSFMGNFTGDLMAHELAHSWFCNYITTSSWHDIWLNEGFATYCTGLYFEHISEDYYWHIWKNNTRDAIISEPNGSVYVYDTTSVSRIYNPRLTYHKGAYLVHMLRWILGDENFFKGMKNYLNDPDLAYGFASTEDLIYHLESVSGFELEEFFSDWYWGEGFPTYQVECITQQNNKLKVRIDQIQSHPSVEFFEMPIPMLFYSNYEDTTIVFDHHYSGQEFIVDPGFTPDSVAIDPEIWLISGENQYSLGIEKRNEGSITIFPNPTKNIIGLSFYNATSSEIKIFDLHGNLLRTLSLPYRNNYILDISTYSPGIYFLVIETEEQIFSEKILKVH